MAMAVAGGSEEPGLVVDGGSGDNAGVGSGYGYGADDRDGGKDGGAAVETYGTKPVSYKKRVNRYHSRKHEHRSYSHSVFPFRLLSKLLGRGLLKTAIFIPVVVFLIVILIHVGDKKTSNRPHVQHIGHLRATINISSQLISTLPPLPSKEEIKEAQENQDVGQKKEKVAGFVVKSTKEMLNKSNDEEATNTPTTTTRSNSTLKLQVHVNHASMSCHSYMSQTSCILPIEYFEVALPQNILSPKPRGKVNAGVDTGRIDVHNFKFTCTTIHDASESNYILLMQSFERICLRLDKMCTSADVISKSHSKNQQENLKSTGKDRPQARQSRERRRVLDYISTSIPQSPAMQSDHSSNGNDIPQRKLSLSTRTQTLNELVVTIRDPTQSLDLGVDESYNLIIPGRSTSMSLISETLWGTIRGLETMFQLIGRLPDDSSPGLLGLPILIEDKPAQPWRGVLLDTSRHFYPVPVIIRLLEGMAMNQLNVLHWHMTDDQSFPIQIDKYPKLARKGAFPPAKKNTYTKDMIKYIVQYAYNRSITVIPEIDIPGHAASWGLGIPELLSCDGGKSPLNPISPKSYEVIEDIIDELAPLFPSKFFHLGGDEHDPSCWKNNPEIFNEMKADDDLEGLKFRQQLVDAGFAAAKRNNKRPIVWKDLVQRTGIQVPLNTIIQHWKCWGYEVCSLHSTLAESAHLAVQSTCAYLDFDNRSWKDFHQAVMLFLKKCGPVGNVELVQGGEAAIWSAHFPARMITFVGKYIVVLHWVNVYSWKLCEERINPQNLFCRAFPRLIAYAERLWSYPPQFFPSHNQTVAFLPRMRAKLLAMRVNDLPVDVEIDMDDDGMCPLLPKSASTDKLDRFGTSRA